MDRKLLEDLVRKGQTAGELLDLQFNHKHHQWARLRVLISELDARFRKIREDKRDEEIEKLISEQSADDRYPFREGCSDWCQEVNRRLVSLRDAMDSWKELPQTVHLEAGDPPPTLRVTPNV